ncbi:MAG: hypothetical protein M3N32_06650, partial [Actinomycetota bacterium]|nr:hypothetical protein [Actinomycetota bacterium]
AEHCRALFVEASGAWTAVEIESRVAHPKEDVSAIRVSGDGRSSIFNLGYVDVRASFPYCMWGYPNDVMHEVVEGGISIPRPDLVFTAGYVRRRLRDLHLPKVRGSRLAELTGAAGSGVSGAPVLGQGTRFSWSVAGIYLGERVSDEVQVGYALLSEAIADWIPQGLGRTLADEAADPGVPPPHKA